MARLANVFRRREKIRGRRDIEGAISNAGSPAMRDELILAAQQANRFSR